MFRKKAGKKEEASLPDPDRVELFKAIRNNDVPALERFIRQSSQTFFREGDSPVPPVALVHELPAYLSAETFKAIAPAIRAAGDDFEKKLFTFGCCVGGTTITHIAAGRNDGGVLFLEMLAFSSYARTATNAKGETPTMIAIRFQGELVAHGIGLIDAGLFAAKDKNGNNAGDHALMANKPRNLEIIRGHGFDATPQPQSGSLKSARAQRPIGRYEL